MTYLVNGIEIEFDPDRFLKDELSMEELYDALESLRGSWKLQHTCIRANAFTRVWLMDVDGIERPVVTFYAFDVSPAPVAQITVGGLITVLNPAFENHKLLRHLLREAVRECLQNKKWYFDHLNDIKVPEGFADSFASGFLGGIVERTEAPEGFASIKSLYAIDAKTLEELDHFMTPDDRKKWWLAFGGPQQEAAEMPFKTPVIPLLTSEDVRQLATDTVREYPHLFGLDTQSPPPPIIHPSGINQFAVNRDWLEWRATKITYTAQMTGKDDHDPAQSWSQALQEAKDHVVRNNPAVFEGKEAEIVPYSSSHTAPYYVRIKKEQ